MDKLWEWLKTVPPKSEIKSTCKSKYTVDDKSREVSGGFEILLGVNTPDQQGAPSNTDKKL